MNTEGPNTTSNSSNELGVPPVPFPFSYDEEDRAAEEAAIEEVAGVAPRNLDNAAASVLTYPGHDAYPSIEDDELSLFDANLADPVMPVDAVPGADESALGAQVAQAATFVPGAPAADRSVPSTDGPAEIAAVYVDQQEPVSHTHADEVAQAQEGAGGSPDSASRSKKDGQPHLRQAPKASKNATAPFTISYRARAVLSFVAIALLTVVVSVGMVALIWGQFFSTYAAGNIEALADQTANRIESAYEKTLSLEGDVLIPAMEMADSSDELGVVVTDSGGNVLYTSASGDSAQDSPSAATQIAIAPIEHGGQAVGSVRVWVYGSSALMSKVDREFQRDTYAALMYAGGISLVIAVIAGILFARALVHPVNRLMRTARELSEGDLSARTGMKGANELSRLGATIDEMAESFERDRKLEKQLTSDVAHELRTPLMAIQATVEAMIDGVYDRDDEHLLLVDAEVQRLSKLVDALLKLSRMEMRTQSVREDVVDLSELADDVVVSHEAFIEDSGLSILLDAQPDVKTIGDADLIKQAIANLVSNAVRYTDEGGSITISVFREGRMAAIAVKDTGIGLTPEEAKMVFSRFWRADSGRAKESGGLGIGLTLVKEIMEQHHGRVSVKGEKGVGSVFTLYFPLYDEERSIAQARMAVRAMERRQRSR